MKRLMTIAGLILVFAAMFGLYELSYRVDRQESTLRHLTGRIAEEKRSIAVLRAEWAYLTRPAAVQDRAVGRLAMQPALPKQLIAFQDVPERQKRLITAASMEMAEGAMLPGGERLPLPRPRPDARLTIASMSADKPAAPASAAPASAAPAPAAPARRQADAAVRTVSMEAPAPRRSLSAGPAVVQVAVQRSAARPSASSGNRLLPADMEAHLLKLAAQQLSGRGAAQALMEGQ